MILKAKTPLAKTMLKHKETAKVSELDIHNLINFFSHKKEFANHFEILSRN
jgi:hypothetical protein